MSRKLLASGLVVMLVVGGLGVASYTDMGPAPGDGPLSESDGMVPTGTTDDRAGTAEPPLAFSVGEIDDCGETCRDVTATVENTQDEPAESVTVTTSIFAGENSTEEVVWEGTEDVGTLAAGESHTSTKRVSLSLGEAYAIDGEDGWITIVTTIDAEDETVTVRESRQVA